MSGPLSISTPAREQTIDALDGASFDCVVIGGGITGAGVALEARLRGLSVALLEAEDFASGTSSRSSKLIHGGLRYLALGDLALVRETALERKEIFRLAPHLAQRCWMVVPARSRAGMLKLRFGISTYERLGAVDDEDLHRNWSAQELGMRERIVHTDRFPYACAYREYLTDDARLVLAVLRAAAARGATVLNHARVTAIPCRGSRATGVEAVCRLGGRSFRVGARAVVNAAGPWVEAVRRLEDEHAEPLLALSKGIHVVLPRERVPLRNLVVLRTRDSRSIFAIPRGPIVFIGTTDSPHPGAARYWPEITSREVEYLLEPLPEYFAVDPVKIEEVLAAWAGLRPLVAQGGKQTTEISRRDEVLVGRGGVVSVVGGKLTGYRPMAGRTIEKVGRTLDRHLAPRRGEGPLPGGDFDGDIGGLAASLATRHGLSRAVALRLVGLYGTESFAVVERGSSPLVSARSILTGEVDWAVEEEGAARLEDWLYRRARAALYLPAEREAVLGPAAERMAVLLGWGPERIEEEVARVRALFDAELGFSRPLA